MYNTLFKKIIMPHKQHNIINRPQVFDIHLSDGVGEGIQRVEL